MSLLSIFKGFIGEAMGSLAHKALLDKRIYHELNNVTIPTPDGTTQIDHVIVSKFGIFVIEAKNMNGWIFGSENAAEWTQSLPGARKYKFQNPLRQNYRHTKCLSDFLGIEHEKLHSVVMFWGDTEFKTPMPANVLDKGYTSYIRSKQEVMFSDEEVEQLVEAIRTGRLQRTWATRRQHVESLKERHGTRDVDLQKVTETSSTPSCPKCGGNMVRRTAKSGEKKGNVFLGCEKFPACRGVLPIS